jgi:hypothetical protein
VVWCCPPVLHSPFEATEGREANGDACIATILSRSRSRCPPIADSD